MKKLLLSLAGIIVLASCTDRSVKQTAGEGCNYNKDSMIVVMRIERKIKPEFVSLFKQSFDACKAEVLAKEPGCLDYSLFQSYNDSTLFCLTEAWRTKGDHNAHMQLDHTKKHIGETRGISDTTLKSKTNYTYWVCPGANKKK
jgi:quinol monooxygenase YgiN